MRKLMFMFVLVASLAIFACSGPNKETVASLDSQTTEMQTLQTSLDETSKGVEAEFAKLTEAKVAAAIADSLVMEPMGKINAAVIAHKELSTRVADLLTRITELKTNYTAGSVKEEQLKTDNETITTDFNTVKEEKEKLEAEIQTLLQAASQVIGANTAPAATTEATATTAPAAKK